MRRALLVAGLLAAATLSSGCLAGGMEGKPVPAFHVVTTDGERVNESTYLGKYVVLDLMATWCGPCILEVAHLKEVQRLHGDDVVILSIGVSPADSPADLDAFSKEHGSTWAHGLDVDGNVGRAMGLGIIPKLVVVDPQGVVVLERDGEVLPAAISRAMGGADALPGARTPSFLPALAALGLGFLALFNPYRRFHRDGPDVKPGLVAIVVLLALAILAWSFADLVSTRATLVSLVLGVASLGAAAWWWKARAKEAKAQAGPLLPEAGDRLYESMPHFALALVFGLQGIGPVAFFAPIAGFLVGAGVAVATRDQVPDEWRARLGVAGLVLAGLGLGAFGVRFVLVYL